MHGGLFSFLGNCFLSRVFFPLVHMHGRVLVEYYPFSLVGMDFSLAQ